jgi:hypothetical protein
VLTQLAVDKGDEAKDPKLFPPGRYDEHGQQVPFHVQLTLTLALAHAHRRLDIVVVLPQVDLRRANSWVLQLDQVSACTPLDDH